MNERIRQLADEAGLRFTQLMSNPMVPVVDGKETDLAKFAELIVRECMQVVHNGINNATDWDSSSWDQCCENRMYAIQKHFGVEE
jgi:hypothetical protein